MTVRDIDDKNTVLAFTGGRVGPTNEDIDGVGKALDELQERWTNGHVGSFVIVHTNPKDKTVSHTRHMLPGDRLLEALGWLEVVKQDILEDIRS